MFVSSYVSALLFPQSKERRYQSSHQTSSSSGTLLAALVGICWPKSMVSAMCSAQMTTMLMCTVLWRGIRSLGRFEVSTALSLCTVTPVQGRHIPLDCQSSPMQVQAFWRKASSKQPSGHFAQKCTVAQKQSFGWQYNFWRSTTKRCVLLLPLFFAFTWLALSLRLHPCTDLSQPLVCCFAHGKCSFSCFFSFLFVQSLHLVGCDFGTGSRPQPGPECSSPFYTDNQY